MKNFDEKNESLQLGESVHDHDDHQENGVFKNGSHYQLFLPIKKRKYIINNNSNKQYNVNRQRTKYRSMKEILRRLDHYHIQSVSAHMGKFTGPTPPPPFSSNYANDDDDSVNFAKETTNRSSDIIDLAGFSFKWGKTDRRSRESRIAASVENYEPVVLEPVVGYKCGPSLKKLLYGMHVVKAAAMEELEYTDDATSRMKKPKKMMN